MREALEKLDLALRRLLDLVAPRLDVVAQPDALVRVGDVLDLVRDRRAVRLAEARQHVGQRVARNFHAQHARGNRALQRRRQAVRLRLERRVADRRRAERIEICRKVTVPAIRGDDRHAGGDRAQHLVRRTARVAPADRRERNLRHRRRLQSERREDRLVKSVPALQQLVDATQIFAGLCALNHAVIVGARDLHHSAKRRADAATVRSRVANPGG